MFEPTDNTPQELSDDLDEFSSNFFEETKNEEVKEEPKEEVETDDNSVVEDDETKVDEGKEEDVPEEDDEDKPEEKPKKVNRFQERINDLTAKAKEAERRAAELEKKLSESKQESPKADVSNVQGPTPDDKNEDGSDKYPLGEFDPTYIRDLTRHTIQVETAAAKEQEKQELTARQHEQARAELQQNWVEKLAPAQEQYEDFMDKTIQLEETFEGLDANYSDYLVQTIKSLDHGPEVLYYFANHLDEAREFVRKGPLEATLALGEINAMFKGQTRKETKVSKAPPPPQVNKGSKTRMTVAPDTDDLDAFSEMFFPKKK